MKIYGQSLGDIFARLPLPYKIVVAAGGIFILFVITYIPLQLLTRVSKPAVPAPVKVFGELQPALGMLDPALAHDPKTDTVWMAYAAEEKAQASDGALVHVRLANARAGDCDRWVQSPGGFDAKPDDILAPDGQTVFRSGAWRIETPTIIYDPDDRGREWKLYAYKYFWAKDPAYTLQVAQHYGMIVYKTSSDPAKGWSTEQWLFSPGPDYPPPPYEQMILLSLNGLDPSLGKVVAYARPSAVYKDGAIVMTLSAFTDGMTPDRVIMIVSRDHGNSWSYVDAPLKLSDVAGIGPYTKLAGATLLQQKDKVYLAAVLGDERQRGLGTFIFGFEDFSKGRLQRDPKTGAPVVLRQLPLQNPQAGALGGGFAAYTDACPQGLFTGEQGTAKANFQIFRTYQQPVGR